MPIVEKRGSFTLSKKDPEEKTMKVKTPVYLNASKTKALPFGHPEANSLLVGTNGFVTEAIAKKYGITEAGAPGEKGESRRGPKAPNTNDQGATVAESKKDAPVIAGKGQNAKALKAITKGAKDKPPVNKARKARR